MLDEIELKKYIDALLSKSEEAYLMSIEIINKPTINYRTEGFCFFICNAWELLLKAFIINKAKDINAINYRDDSNRTIGLDECVEKIFTSTTDKVKNNISFIRNIRNKSTHLILPEFDFMLAPAFQRCLTNYNKFFKKHFPDYSLNEKITPFIALVNPGNNKDSSSLVLNPVNLLLLDKLQEELDSDENLTQTIKLVIPGACNANCSFCYNRHSNKMEIGTYELKRHWLDNFLSSLEQIILKIDGKQPISVDITGNEPTLDTNFFIEVMHKLRSFHLKNKINRITCTTNGIGLKNVAPFMNGVVNYVNISVHDYDQERRNNIFGSYFPTDSDYEEAIQLLLDSKIHTSAIAVIHNEINDFPTWRDNFIKWADKIGFVSLRFRNNVYYGNNNFLDYMNDTINDKRFYTIQKENTPDSNWCQLATKDGFLVFFLKGVIDTYSVSPGIEFIVHDDGKAYADFNKTIPFEEYNFPVGYVFDKK